MNPQNEPVTIEIARVLSSDLSLRGRAKEFFDSLESITTPTIEVDFSGVRFISRAFAQEYLRCKKESRKDIQERNLPTNVRKMFMVVENPRSKRQIIGLDNLPVTRI